MYDAPVRLIHYYDASYTKDARFRDWPLADTQCVDDNIVKLALGQTPSSVGKGIQDMATLVLSFLRGRQREVIGGVIRASSRIPWDSPETS